MEPQRPAPGVWAPSVGRMQLRRFEDPALLRGIPGSVGLVLQSIDPGEHLLLMQTLLSEGQGGWRERRGQGLNICSAIF